jgi:hypothetical protein
MTYQSLYERALIDLWPHIAPTLGGVCLDLGRGSGVLNQFLASSPNIKSVMALDATGVAPQSQWLDIVKQKGPFDLIISHATWPLYWPLKDRLSSIYKHLVPKGQMLIHIPISFYVAADASWAKMTELTYLIQDLPPHAEVWAIDYLMTRVDDQAIGAMWQDFCAEQGLDMPSDALATTLKRSGDKAVSRHIFINLIKA